MNKNLDIYCKTPSLLKKKKKVTDNNFTILKFSEWRKLEKNNYKIPQLKKIASKYKLKKGGKKNELLYRVINFLRLSYYTIKIQKKWKLFLRKTVNKLKGPAYLNRKCTNTDDFLSLTPLKCVSYDQFFSYKCKDNFIYGFNIKSIFYLLQKEKTFKNPYNRKKIKNNEKKNIKKLILYSKFLNDKTNINIDFNVGIISKEKKIEMKCISIFNKIDTFGYTTHSNWFLELNNRKIKDYLKLLYDLWDYRLSLDLEMKKAISPPNGNPFGRINFYRLRNEQNNLILKEMALEVMNNLINKSNNEKMQTLGAMYILGILTIVSKNASDVLPWLYESFAVQN